MFSLYIYTHTHKILFLNDGVIEAEGKHEELLEGSKHYHDLYQAELKI